MTLARTPIPSHDWPQGREAGPPQTCETCGSEWAEGYQRPPPWPCRRNSRLDRSSGLSPVSDTNSGRAHQRDEAYRAYVRRLGCLVCDGRPCDAHHVDTWGSGKGDWLDDGRGNLAPLCREHHGDVDRPGWGPETFEAEYGVDMEHEAERIGEAFKARQGGEE